GALAMTIYPPKYDDYAPAESTDAAPRINPRARLGSQAEEPMNAVPREHLIGTPPTRELNVSNHLIGTPPMRELSVSNHLLGNRAALDAAWDRDGYWFFRDVLDKNAIARVRAIYLRVLDRLGVIDPSRTDAAVYNGASLENFPIVMGGDP